MCGGSFLMGFWIPQFHLQPRLMQSCANLNGALKSAFSPILFSTGAEQRHGPLYIQCWNFADWKDFFSCHLQWDYLDLHQQYCWSTSKKSHIGCSGRQLGYGSGLSQYLCRNGGLWPRMASHRVCWGRKLEFIGKEEERSGSIMHNGSYHIFLPSLSSGSP